VLETVFRQSVRPFRPNVREDRVLLRWQDPRRLRPNSAAPTSLLAPLQDDHEDAVLELAKIFLDLKRLVPAEVKLPQHGVESEALLVAWARCRGTRIDVQLLALNRR